MVGSRIEVLLKDGWSSGIVESIDIRASDRIIMIRLDDGRRAMCASEGCIRPIK